MKCPMCGEENAVDRRFCRECGVQAGIAELRAMKMQPFLERALRLREALA